MNPDEWSIYYVLDTKDLGQFSVLDLFTDIFFSLVIHKIF